MKVALLIDHIGAGGAQRQITGLACLLKERGVDVKLYTYYPMDFYEQELKNCGVSHEIVAGADSHFRRFFLLRKRFKEEQPDVVISYLDTPCMLACLIKKTGVNYKLIVSERNTTQRMTKTERVKFMLYRWADCIVPNSFSQRDFIINNFPSCKGKTVTIPNYVDLDKFSIEGTRVRKARPTIMVAASVWASKNTKGFIEAIKLLKSKTEDFEVRWYGLNRLTQISGNIAYMEDCFKLIKEYRLENHFLLLDKTKDIKVAYLEDEYFCLPSFYEGTSNALCEALSMSLPIACSAVCDNPVYVEDGKNGVLFDPKSPEEMSDALYRLLSLSKEEYSQYADNSRIMAERQFTKERFVDSYLKLISCRK